ncbi:MAG: CARDB domain-containing protein [Pseudomonadota bacterium]
MRPRYSVQLMCMLLWIFLATGFAGAQDVLTKTVEPYPDVKQTWTYYLNDTGSEIKHGSDITYYLNSATSTWYKKSEKIYSHGDLASWTDWSYSSADHKLRRLEEAVKEQGTFQITITEWGDSPAYDHITVIGHYNGSSMGDSYTLHGKRTRYYPDGVKSAEDHWVYGKEDGLSKTYHPNGVLKTQTEYWKGIKNNYERQWTQTGTLIRETPFQNGLQHGTYREWTDGTDPLGLGWTPVEGLLLYTIEYRYGTMHGPYKSYTDWMYGAYSELILEQGRYSNGNRCGDWEKLNLGTNYIDPDSLGPFDEQRIGYVKTVHGSCETLEIPEPNPYPEIDAQNAQVQKEVRGQITDRQTHDPISGAVISAEGGASTTSDSKGFYSFTLPGEATYKISVSKTGYYSRSGTANLQNIQYKRMNASLIKVAASPAITSVESKYGNFFMEGVPLTNEYRILIDWNGEPPGVVKFAVNGKVSEVAAAGNEITKSFNMGMDFKAGLRYLTNNLQIMAVSKAGARSQTERLHPIVIPIPAWSAAFGKFGDLKIEDNLITYNLKKTWPEKPVEIQINPETLGSFWNLWSLFPLVGGKNFGIPATQAFLDIEAKTDGSGSVTSGGKTGFQAAGQDLQGKLGGKGKLQYEYGKGLEWKGSSLILGLEGTIKKEVGPVTLIPALEGAVNLGFGVGRVITWFNSLAKIEGKVKSGYDIDLQLINSKGEIGFQQSEGTISNGIELGLSMGASKLKAELSGGGTNKAYWQFPANPGYMKKIEAELSAKMAMAIWLFSKDFTAEHKFVYPDDTTSASLMDRSVMSLADFQPISRNFLLHPPYSSFTGTVSGLRNTMGIRTPTSQVGDPAKLITNIYPYSEPVVAAHQGHTAIAFVYFDPADPTLQATEIYFTYDSGAGFSTPAPIINDTRAEFAPTLAFDAQGNLVCVWERIKDTNFTGTQIDDMARSMEIVYAVYNPTSKIWSSPVQLTDNAYLDHSPVLKTGTDGSLMLIWQSNQGNDIIGDATNPTTVQYAFWNQGGFDPAKSIPAQFEDSFKFSLAYHDGSNAFLAYMREMDGNMATTGDEEIFYLTYDGSNWTDPVRLTNDQVADVSPQAIYRTDGTIELVWVKNDALVRLNDLATGGFDVIRADATSVAFTDLKIARDPSDRLFVYWQGLDEQGTDIFYSVYDPDQGVWSQDLRISRDPAMERFVNGQFASDGKLHLVFTQENMADATSDYIPTDLFHLTYMFSTDLAISSEGLSVQEGLPAPGALVTLEARIENKGDLPLKHNIVTFYHGDPAQGGTLIGQADVDPATLKAGDFGTARQEWTIPQTFDSTMIFAVVAPENTLVETDQTNNQAYFTLIKPDIEAVQIKIDNQSDGSLDLIAVIRNNGTIPVKDIPISFHAGGTDQGTITIPGLLPLKQAEITHTILIGTTFSNWQNDISIQVDPKNLIIESDETNNEAQTRFHPLGISPSAHDFERVPIGSTSMVQQFTFTNPVNMELTLGSVNIIGDNKDEFQLINDACSGALMLNGDTCTMDVSFTPATLGIRSAFLSISNQVPDLPILTEIPLYGGQRIDPGDMDGDTDVDMDDAILSLQLLSGKKQTTYSDADADNNKKIDAQDTIYVQQKASNLR